LLMKLKFNKDHYQGQNEAWKSAIHILQGLLLKCHINFKKIKKIWIFYHTYIRYPCIYLKNFSSKFWILTPFQRCQRLLIWFIDILNTFMCMWVWGLVAWHLVGKRRVKADPWEWGGLGFDSGWWGLIP
jgi:hypothetical protein